MRKEIEMNSTTTTPPNSTPLNSTPLTTPPDPTDLDAFLHDDNALVEYDAAYDDDALFLTLDDSLSLQRWLLDDILSSKWFFRTFVLFFCIPLFCFLPWYANTNEAGMAPEKIIASCIPDPSTGEVTNPICIEGRTAHKLLWYCSAWPPVVYLFIVGHYVTIQAIRKKYHWYHDLLWSAYEKNLKQTKMSLWENARQRKERTAFNARVVRKQARDVQRQKLKQYCVCVCPTGCHCPQSFPRCVRGPCVCLNVYIYTVVGLVCCVVLPLAVLLPIW